MATVATGLAAPIVVKPEQALKQAFPTIPFDTVTPTEIPGLYEVIAGTAIFYYYPEKDLIIVGEMVNKELKNLTAERKGEIMAKQAKSLPLEKAVKVGSGKHVIIEFTDPDCPYCKRAAEFLRTRTDVTRYVFFTPLAHPQAITKIHYILNAADKAKAYEDMMQGKAPEAPAAGYSEAVKALAQEHMALAKKMGVSGTPTFYIEGNQVVGADTKRMEQLLQEPAATPAKK
jgi:thiol:disulfide interchange protein DsbC